MSLFGRRRGASEAAAAPAAEQPQPGPAAPSRGRRRRRSRNEAARQAAAAAVAPIPAEEPARGPSKPARGGRRRRPPARAAPSARRRRRGTQPEAPTEVDMEAAVRAVAARAGAQASGLEGLLTRQGAVLEAYASEQLKVMQGILRSLAALEVRAAPPSPGAAAQVPTALPRLAVFVDVPNIMYAAERRGVAIDWGRVLEFLSRGREVVRATAYAPISDDPTQRLSEQRFVQPFIGRGYRIA